MAARKPRRLWSTTQGPEASSVVESQRRRHESQAEAYRYVQNDATNYAARSGTGYTYTDVWVDERDGRGWQHFERVQMADLATRES